MKRGLILLGICYSFMIFGCGRLQSPDSFANSFMQNLKDGKQLAVQESLSKDMKQMATLMGGVSDQSLNPYYRSGKMLNYSLESTERTKNAVRYKVTVDCIDGKKYEDSMDLVFEDGKWRVSRF